MLMTEGPKETADLEATNLELPEYYDPRKFDLGQRAFRDNVFTMMVAKLAGLLTLLAVPSILEILVFTKQSGTPCAAFRRYVSTILHTFVWYRRAPNKRSEFFDSLRNVRKKHCVVSRRCSEAGLGRISQLDMALTQFGFIGFVLLSGDQLGVAASEEELEGLVHLWRIIGNLLGMEERFNLCNGTVKETKALCERLLDEVFLPCLASRNTEFERMGRILLQGLWPVNPHLDPDAFQAFTLHLASSSTRNNNHSICIDKSSMGWYSRFMLEFQLFVHHYLMPKAYRWSVFFRAFFNAQTRLSIYLTEKLPFLAYWTFGRKRSHVDIYKLR
ncbi:uncharacterized protein LOC105697327 isoform X2 [Orussus abietinus]|nr:uncharacterized protein LOC105697327 isoform X2 [Orussus abietinus]